MQSRCSSREKLQYAQRSYITLRKIGLGKIMKLSHKLWASVAVIPLLLMGGNESEIDTAHAQPADGTEYNLFLSENAAKSYGGFRDVINQSFDTGTRAVLITPSDLGMADENYDEHNLLLYTLCDYEDTPKPEETRAVLDTAANRIITHLNAQGFDKLTDELAALKEKDPETYQEAMDAIAIFVLTDTQAALAMPAISDEIKSEVAIIAFPDEPKDPAEFTTLLSGMPAEYTQKPSGTKEDWALFVLAHEATHAFNLHGTGYSEEQLDNYCKAVDPKFLAESLMHEGDADVAASDVFVLAQKLGLTENTQLLKDVVAYRSLSTLHQSGTLLSMENNEDVNVHLTNLVFDPANPHHKDDLDLSDAPFSYEMPLHINTVTDAVAAYLKLQDYKEQLAENPDQFSAQEQADIASNPDSLAMHGDTEYFKSLVEYGTDLRISGEHEYYYAAVFALNESGAYNQMLQNYGEHSHVMLDILNDYIEASHTHGTDKLKDERLTGKAADLVENHKADLLGVVGIFNTMLNAPTPQPETADLPSFDNQ